jgi:hypothetical protein
MSVLALRALLALMDEADLNLCEQFIVHNPARLPTPAQWVNVTRTRVKDAFTHLWWLSRTDAPKADNRRVLRPYGRTRSRRSRTACCDFRPALRKRRPRTVTMLSSRTTRRGQTWRHRFGRVLRAPQHTAPRRAM